MAQDIVTHLIRNVVNKLIGIKGRVEQHITATKDKGDRLLGGVEEWVVNAESHISEAKEVIDGVEANAKKKCFNLEALYRYDVKRIKEEVEVAAKRIKNGEKILVILDDVWGELKLDEVGIPCGAAYKNYKILLTSKSRDVCEIMKATHLISVDSLQPEEAWILFKRVVGDTVETDENLKKIAEKVVEGCGGLPLIIQAVGVALKDECWTNLVPSK
nr:NB-ARC domains-containing protein [Tanacetum cinerariifolium]